MARKPKIERRPTQHQQVEVNFTNAGVLKSKSLRLVEIEDDRLCFWTSQNGVAVREWEVDLTKVSLGELSDVFKDKWGTSVVFTADDDFKNEDADSLAPLGRCMIGPSGASLKRRETSVLTFQQNSPIVPVDLDAEFEFMTLATTVVSK